VAGPDPLVAGSFAVLRRERRTEDVLPPDALALVGTGKDGQSQIGLNAELARRVGVTSDGGNVFVVPAEGRTCILTTRVEARGLSCVLNHRVLKEGMWMTQAALRGVDGLRVQAIVPDGVASVRIIGGDREVDVPVADNSFSADVPGNPTHVEWRGHDGPVLSTHSL
jgi:hypothetical protein